MRHRKKVKKLGRDRSHRKSLLSNLVKDLIKKGKVDTTTTKAGECAKLAEKMITLAKGDNTHSRRQAFKFLGDKEAVKMLFEEIGPKYQNRNGGYVRLLKLPPRKGDGAEMARLTWV
jgi:large subunit ribosomal protein L17